MKNKGRPLQIAAAGVLSAAMLAGLAQVSEPAIRVSSYKGVILETGERSLLIIGPAEAEYTASSSSPAVVNVERVLTYWVAVATSEGTAEITVTGQDGAAGSLTLTVRTQK